MAKEKSISEKKIRDILSKRIERMNFNADNGNLQQTFTPEELTSLLNELNGYQFEFETQDDELKISNETLAAEREKFADLYDYAPIGYFILDHLGIVEEVNQKGVDLLGYSRLSLQNKRFQSFISPDHLEEFYDFLYKIKESDEKVTVEVKLVLPNKKFLFVRIEGIGIQNFVTSNVKYYITVSDISSSREVQQLLKETKERLEMTLRASSTGIWSIEQRGNRMTLDEYSYQVLELQPSEFNGNLKSFFNLIHPDDKKRVRSIYKNSLKQSSEIDIEFRVISKNGSLKFVAIKGQKVNLSDNQIFAGIIMDITERKRLAFEAENLKLLQQREVLSATINAQESERFKISRALHDSVCQGLYGIRLGLQSVPYYKNNKEEFKSINQLLDQAIKETREISYELTPSVLKDFGFTAGVKEMAGRLNTSDFCIRVNIRQSVDALDETIQLYAFRIIQELLNNCIKHSNASLVDVVVQQQADLVKILVTDNGQGFREDFSQSSKHGSGLRGIKNQLFLLNGDLDLSTSAAGTTIKVTFNRNVNLAN